MRRGIAIVDVPALPMKQVHARTWSLAALLAALSMLGPFSIDMYLPAFHAIAADLRVSQLAVQQTLSSFLFAYAFMSLWHGALSDALGRRPIILAGLGVYAFATLGCAIAGNIETLWMFRTLQGVTAGAGFVVGRAIIRDRFHGAEAQRLMSQITLVFGVAPALAPVVGGAMLNTFGWRSMFWMLLLLVIALLWWSGRASPKRWQRPIASRCIRNGYGAITSACFATPTSCCWQPSQRSTSPPSSSISPVRRRS